MEKQLRYKIGDKVRILKCEYSENTQTEGFEGVIATLYEGNSDYQYRIDLGDKTDKYGDPYTLMADDEIELVDDKEEEMKVEKVKLPKEIAEALDFIEQTRDYPIRAVVDIFNGMKVSEIQIDALYKYFEEDRSRRIENVTKALVSGYEAELTPEDRVREIYDGWKNRAEEHGNLSQIDLYDKYRHFMYATRAVLNELGVHIEGVTNDNLPQSL